MDTIRIFIASSAELIEDRKEFREFLSVENDRLHTKGVYLELIQWENFLDTVSQTSLQDEYNIELKKSQIVICLFYTKAGKYTQAEFDAALQQFKETGSPLIYTYFKSGAPEPGPADQLAKDLVTFKKRLSDIGHFYTSYDNIDDLKYQFRKQLDRLEDKGIINVQHEVAEQTKEAVTNYFNIKNLVTGNITAGGDVNIGDKISNTANATGDNNIIIQGVTDSSITVNVNGQSKEIEKKLDVLQALMEQMAVKSVQSANATYSIGNITDANFGFLMGQAGHDRSLPASLSDNLVGEGDQWIKGLRMALLKQGIPVGDDPMEIFQNYDWLIQAFLQKMCSPPGQEKNLRRLAFMAETYQASLRYLCYIQMAQVLQQEKKTKLGIISDFIQMEDDEFLHFDYSSLLLTSTDLLGPNGFVAEISKFVNELTDTGSDLFGTAFFLDAQRRNLMAGAITEDDRLPVLLDEYLTALVFWLKNISFIANYRLVSIKDINLNFRLGADETYLHRYGELHSMYNEGGVADKTRSIEIRGSFTFSKSILLFKGNALAACLKNIRDKSTYISLSPLLIDKSVYADDNNKQTPEIFYYAGYEKLNRQYNYTPYNKELALGKAQEKTRYPSLNIKATNTDLSGLDDLFEQLEEIFNPFKIKQS
jgi:hypothetical protein